MRELQTCLAALRQKQPVICCLTNSVTTDFVCNALLSVHAAPIVSQAPEEIAELLQHCQALYINIGTLDRHFIALTEQALAAAGQQGVPVILDPVGSGATTLRTGFARRLLDHVDIVRGNASEVLSLQQNLARSAGVESLDSVCAAKTAARTLAQRHQLCVAVSGAEDFITDGQRAVSNPWGSALMRRVTGMGCSLTAVIAAFAAVEADAFNAARLAIRYYTLCAQWAAQQTASPASFKVRFLDTLGTAPFAQLEELCRAH